MRGGPIVEAMFTPAGIAHTREMLDSRMRDRMLAFTIQGEDVPQALLDSRQGKNYRLIRCLGCEKLSWSEE